MALSKLIFKPGINRDQTNYASEGGWYDTQLVRFRSGFPEKFGGWSVSNINPYTDSARAIFSWSATDGSNLIGIGTNSRVYVGSGTTLYDITPIYATYTTSTVPSSDNCIGTTNGSKSVIVTITDHGATTGTYVTLSGITGPTIGGIPITEMNTTVQVTVLTVDTFTFEATTTASSTTTGQGGTSITAVIYLPAGFPIATAGYGWGTSTWNRLTWGSGSTVPIFEPARLIFMDKFNNDLLFNTQYDTLSGDGGEIYYWAFTPSFSTQAVTLNSVSGSVAVPQKVTKIMFTPQGFLLALGCTNYLASTVTGATISTMTRGGTGNLTATVTTTTAHGLSSGDSITVSGTTPAEFNGTFQITYIDTTHFSYTMLSAPSGNASPAGTYVFNNYAGSYDPLLIRWSNVDPDIGPEPENWQPTITNTAGFLRLQSGSRIVTGINTRQETLIFTNSSLSSLQFLGNAEVFGLQELSHNISIIGPNALVGSNNITYWMGRDRFYTYSGRVDTLPCTIRQYIFTDLNFTQSALIFAGVNNKFTEIIWFYCSAASEEIDRYVVFNYLENIWYYGQLSRTAWIDSGVFNNPIGLSSGWVYQHENGTNDGQPLGAAPLPITAYIQSADIDIDDGDKFMLIRRVIPDINFRGSDTANEVTGNPIIPEADITVVVRNFPGAASSITNAEGQTTDATIVTATATVDQYTNQVFIRARGRQMNFRIASDTVGTQWQLGMPRIDARPDGTRA